MKTQTDNSNIVVQESLTDAITAHTNNLPHATMRAKSFKDGANWQKEQLLPLIESHARLLKILTVAKNELWENEKGWDVIDSAIEKANNITKTINK